MRARAAILTPYIGSGEDPDTYRSLLEDTYTCQHITDVTNLGIDQIIPGINLHEVEITCDAETLALIEADNRFAILWSEP